MSSMVVSGSISIDDMALCALERVFWNIGQVI